MDKRHSSEVIKVDFTKPDLTTKEKIIERQKWSPEENLINLNGETSEIIKEYRETFETAMIEALQKLEASSAAGQTKAAIAELQTKSIMWAGKLKKFENEYDELGLEEMLEETEQNDKNTRIAALYKIQLGEASIILHDVYGELKENDTREVAIKKIENIMGSHSANTQAKIEKL